MNNSSTILRLGLVGSCLVAGTVLASPDYPPARWFPEACGQYYTSGYGHKFYVIHTMQGYYASGLSYIANNCSVSLSVHYCINSVKETTTDYVQGEVAQTLYDSYYAWHARCWNQHSMGTEHEGFVSNPAWYTDEMYQNSADLTRSKADKFGFAKDRNHVVAHSQKSDAAWCTWAEANLGIDAHCNTHSDPGQYWDWTKFMGLINPAVNNASVVSMTKPSTVNAGATFSATVVMKNTGTTAWLNPDATPHNLGSQNPQDNARWGLGRVAVAGTVLSGANGTFTFNCTAPTTAGTYAFDWKMVEDGVAWFGATATGTITVSAAAPVDIIVDNTSGSFSCSANWATATSSTDKYGTNYRYRSTAAVTDMATFTANLPSAGTYAAYCWYPQGANRCATTPYKISTTGGEQTISVNQQANGGKWVLLGTWAMAAGNNTIKISCWQATGFNVMADAVRWVKQ